MTGSEGVNVPDPQSQVANKTVSDVCSLTVSVSGKTAFVKGTCEKIDTPWAEFSSGDNNTGHFAIVKLPEWFASKKVEVVAGSGHNKTWDSFDADTTLITRLDDYKTQGDMTQKFKVEGEEVLTVDYSGVTWSD